MAAVVTYDLERTQEIVDGVTVNGTVNGSKHLILTREDAGTVDAGAVGGPQGFQGPERPFVPGHISLYAGATAPLGWMLCDGSIISRANFPELFASIGTTYGVGDGSTTFHLPDLRGRVPVAPDGTTEFNALGARGGEKTHVLTTAEMPAHTHTVLGYSNVDDKNFTGNVGRMNAADTYGQNNTTYDKPTGSTGGDAAHNNLQPYQTLNYIIAIGKAAPQGGGIAKARYFTNTTRGTTTQRDTLYGVPGTAAARVALANQQVTWFNTDLGWKERYYEVTASAGLTALGLVTGATPGWYPISDGPFIDLVALNEVTNFYNTFITGWSILNRKGGASWFTLNGTDRVDVLKHGRYDMTVYTTMYPGSGAPDFSFQLLASDNATLVRGVGGGAFAKDGYYNLRPHQELRDQIITANQKVGWKLQKGTMPAGDTTMIVHGGGTGVERARLNIRYIAPPLNDLQ